MIGLLAIGTSCLALVWVIGRSRVPAPPARIKPFIRGEISTGSVSEAGRAGGCGARGPSSLGLERAMRCTLRIDQDCARGPSGPAAQPRGAGTMSHSYEQVDGC